MRLARSQVSAWFKTCDFEPVGQHREPFQVRSSGKEISELKFRFHLARHQQEPVVCRASRPNCPRRVLVSECRWAKRFSRASARPAA